MPKCDWTVEDKSGPIVSDIECTRPATQRAVISMPDSEGWDTFEIFACDIHLEPPLVADAYMRVIKQWEPL